MAATDRLSLTGNGQHDIIKSKDMRRRLVCMDSETTHWHLHEKHMEAAAAVKAKQALY